MAAGTRVHSLVVVVLLALGALALALVQAPAANALPSDRAYEMVTPPDKNYGDLGAGLTNSSSRASINGEAMAYSVAAGFGDAASNTLTSGYLATRGTDFWSSTATTLPIAAMAAITYFGPTEVSPDLSKAVVITNMDQATQEELPAGQPYAWYLYDPATKQADRMTPPSPDGSDYELDKSGGAQQMSGSTDFSTVYFSQNATLTANAVGIAGDRMYRYTEDGNLSLASLLPDGTPIAGVIASGTFTGNKIFATPHAVSEDGDIVFFNRGSTNDGQELYRSDYSSGSTPDTELVNESENTLETVPVGPARFIGAAADGSIAYFSSDQRLVDADTDDAKDLYRWDADAATGSRLTLISTGGDATSGVHAGYAVSDDGEIVYFGHRGQLLPEAPATTDIKVYAWDGDLHYVTHSPYQGPFSYSTATSANGQYFGFLSNQAGITPEDNGGTLQLYRYDLADESLACASCVPLPGANTKPAQLLATGLTLAQLTDEPRRNVSNNGDVFFDTEEALLPNQDTNNRRDVYMWSDGEVDLLSSGRNKYASLFEDASVSGDDVFLRTFERLSAWDVDDHSDIYDARVGGGLPEPPPPEVPCSGSSCQGPPSLPPADIDPGSSTYEGNGNQASRCANLARKADHAQHRVRKLKRQARNLRADGKRHKAKRVVKRAKRVQRSHKRVARRANRCERRASK